MTDLEPMTGVEPMTAAQPWTDEQLRAIERREGDLLLDAGAGSGKTSVLVERFARAVIHDGLEVSSILAITFTDKAAAELRDRIRARLRELGATDQARATEGAFISTIHGFCTRVLRAGALAAGLDPSFVVLDRDQSELLAVAAFEDALQGLEGPSGGVELIADYGAAALRDAILAVYGQLRSQGQRTPRLPPCPPPPGPEATAELQRAALAAASELAAIEQPGTNVVEACRRLERCRELLAGAEPWPGELYALKLPGNGAALSTDACIAIGEALAAYRAACAARAAGPVRDRLDTLLAAFGDQYRERKQAVSGLDFEDLELAPDARAAAQPRGVARALCTALCADHGRPAPGDQPGVQLELIESIASANLFTVGDAQQLVDLSLPARRRGAVRTPRRAAGGVRAARDAADGVSSAPGRRFWARKLNAAFQTQLGERFKPLVAGRGADERCAGGDPLVELLLVDKGADWELEGLASPWRLAEARALADRLARLVADGTSPGQIVVLTRATTDMRVDERALEQRGLPTYVIGGRGYALHPQVLDVVAYLRVLANPLDEQSLYTVLCSPLVGVSFDALVVLAGVAREQDRDPSEVLREPGDELDGLAGEDRRALSEFQSWFGPQRARAPRRGLETLMTPPCSRPVTTWRCWPCRAAGAGCANVRKLMRLAREYQREHGPDLHGFLALVAERRPAARVTRARAKRRSRARGWTRSA